MEITRLWGSCAKIKGDMFPCVFRNSDLKFPLHKPKNHWVSETESKGIQNEGMRIFKIKSVLFK